MRQVLPNNQKISEGELAGRDGSVIYGNIISGANSSIL
jgi:hypothetical protein